MMTMVRALPREDPVAAKKIPAGEFKAKCLQLMDEVQSDRVPLIITKRGKPVAKLVPVDDEQPRLFGKLRGTVVIQGELIEPTGERWDVDA